jgi:protein-S-isoprenylcysteine O-methyltransferase Ste14
LFSFFGLVAVLFYQFSIRSVLLFIPPTWLQYLGALIMGVGVVFMGLMIGKYFMQLSGVKWLYKDEVSSKLEVTGVHHYVRHPLYFGTFAFIWGWLLISPYISYFIACVIITVYTMIGLKFEEEKLILEFGDEYLQYKKNVPKIIPKFKKKVNSSQQSIQVPTHQR